MVLNLSVFNANHKNDKTSCSHNNKNNRWWKLLKRESFCDIYKNLLEKINFLIFLHNGPPYTLGRKVILPDEWTNGRTDDGFMGVINHITVDARHVCTQWSQPIVAENVRIAADHRQVAGKLHYGTGGEQWGLVDHSSKFGEGRVGEGLIMTSATWIHHKLPLLIMHTVRPNAVHGRRSPLVHLIPCQQKTVFVLPQPSPNHNIVMIRK